MSFPSRFQIYVNIGRLYFLHNNVMRQRFYHNVPFLDFYEKTTGQTISESYFAILKKRHPHIDTLSNDRLQCTLQILKKFDIDAMEACRHLHVFSMNPITMDNYGEILKEVGFCQILPKHIIKYHTIVKSRTIEKLKKDCILPQQLNLEEVLLNKFEEWPDSCKTPNHLDDSNTILTVRVSILQRYLQWRLSVTPEEFQKLCRCYLPLRHKPMSDIKETLDIAQNDLKFDIATIKRNGFIISSDPINTKLILENVQSIAGYHIRDVIRIEPAIVKNNYNAILHIRNLLEEYRISVEAQRRCLKVYCMCPKTVKERLDDLRNLKEYQVLATNPRVLSMVVHKNKMLKRLNKIQAANKQCYSLNHLISSTKVFNHYISSFGNKVCGRDIAVLITTSLQSDSEDEGCQTTVLKEVVSQLKKHKYWLHTALNIIDGNIKFLKEKFSNTTILNNCHLLLYPVLEVEHNINSLLGLRSGETDSTRRTAQGDQYINNLKHALLTDDQILSLVLYEIERKYHFSGDGIWSRQDSVKAEQTN